jgi:hypothetical protein
MSASRRKRFLVQHGQGSYVCETGAQGPFLCGGVRLTFDQPVAVRSFFDPGRTSSTGYYGFLSGSGSGIDLWADGNTTVGSSWFQPAVLTSISADGLTVQLNTTWVAPHVSPPSVVRYAWHDYPPSMPLVSAVTGLPVGPFNATITAAAP